MFYTIILWLEELEHDTHFDIKYKDVYIPIL